jgi:predicted small lipoprotein YifL
MRYHLDFMRLLLAVTRLLLLVAAMALAASACGQRGPLYLRDNPPAGVKPEKRDTYKPVPYPRQAPEENQ